MLAIILLICLAFCAYFYSTWKRRHLVNLAMKIPMHRNYLPLIGHGHLLIGGNTRILKCIQEASKHTSEQGGITTLWLNTIPYFLITDPTDAATVLNTCLSKNYLYKFFDPWMKGLLNLDVSTWNLHRRLLNPAFNPQVLHTFQHIFNKQSRNLVDKLSTQLGIDYDVGETIANVALDTICETSLGTPLEGEQVVDDEYRMAVQKMFAVIMRRIIDVWLHFDFIFNLTKFRKVQDDACKILHASAERFIEERKQEYTVEKNNNKGDNQEHNFKPFLQIMLELADKNTFTAEDLRSEVETMIVAGHDTSAIVLTYTFITLGSYPDVQEKVYQELREIFGDSDRDVEKEDLTRMVYLDAVIHETLRLYPIAAIIVRQIDKDVKITNYTLPAGGCCFVPFVAIHRSPEWGADAEEFRPERWLDPASLPQQAAAFGGFSIGRRRCIGRSYALQSMKTTMAHVIRKYKLTADCSKLEFMLDVLMRPIAGHHVTVQAR